MNSTKSSNFVLKCFEVHVKALTHFSPLLLPLILSWGMLAFYIDKLVHFFVAISRGMTINEMSNP